MQLKSCLFLLLHEGVVKKRRMFRTKPKPDGTDGVSLERGLFDRFRLVSYAGTNCTSSSLNVSD